MKSKTYLAYTLSSISTLSLSIALMDTVLPRSAWAMEEEGEYSQAFEVPEKYSHVIIKQEKTEEEELTIKSTVRVKVESGLESSPKKRRKAVTIKEIDRKLPLINRYIKHKDEESLEICLACNVSLHNHLISGVDPEPVYSTYKPRFEHMEPIDGNRSRVIDPLLEKLSIAHPTIMLEEDENGKIKPLYCLSSELPPTFLPLRLAALKEKVESEGDKAHYKPLLLSQAPIQGDIKPDEVAIFTENNKIYYQFHRGKNQEQFEIHWELFPEYSGFFDKILKSLKGEMDITDLTTEEKERLLDFTLWHSNTQNIPWHQYEEGGETFKTGILYLPHRDNSTQAHFLTFHYYKEEASKGKRKTSKKFNHRKKTKSVKNPQINKGGYVLYIIDPKTEESYTLEEFLENYEESYAKDIKIWDGQHTLNYDCNKTVREMFADLKKEKEEELAYSLFDTAEDASTSSEPTLKRERLEEEEMILDSLKRLKFSSSDLEKADNNNISKRFESLKIGEEKNLPIMISEESSSSLVGSLVEIASKDEEGSSDEEGESEPLKEQKPSNPHLEQNISNTSEQNKENPWARLHAMLASKPQITPKNTAERPFDMDQGGEPQPSRKPNNYFLTSKSSFTEETDNSSEAEEEVMGINDDYVEMLRERFERKNETLPLENQELSNAALDSKEAQESSKIEFSKGANEVQNNNEEGTPETPRQNLAFKNGTKKSIVAPGKLSTSKEFDSLFTGYRPKKKVSEKEKLQKARKENIKVKIINSSVKDEEIKTTVTIQNNINNDLRLSGTKPFGSEVQSQPPVTFESILSDKNKNHSEQPSKQNKTEITPNNFESLKVYLKGAPIENARIESLNKNTSFEKNTDMFKITFDAGSSFEAPYNDLLQLLSEKERGLIEKAENSLMFCPMNTGAARDCKHELLKFSLQSKDLDKEIGKFVQNYRDKNSVSASVVSPISTNISEKWIPNLPNSNFSIDFNATEFHISRLLDTGISYFGIHPLENHFSSVGEEKDADTYNISDHDISDHDISIYLKEGLDYNTISSSKKTISSSDSPFSSSNTYLSSSNNTPSYTVGTRESKTTHLMDLSSEENDRRATIKIDLSQEKDGDEQDQPLKQPQTLQNMGFVPQHVPYLRSINFGHQLLSQQPQLPIQQGLPQIQQPQGNQLLQQQAYQPSPMCFVPQTQYSNNVYSVVPESYSASKPIQVSPTAEPAIDRLLLKAELMEYRTTLLEQACSLPEGTLALIDIYHVKATLLTIIKTSQEVEKIARALGPSSSSVRNESIDLATYSHILRSILSKKCSKVFGYDYSIVIKKLIEIRENISNVCEKISFVK